jgi:hypothetical protein
VRARDSAALAAVALAAAILLAGCGAMRHSPPASTIPRSLLLQTRPIGRGAAFHPPPTGAPIGPCTRTLGPRVPTHVEVFAANRVVIVPAGIGVRPPLALVAGRITSARCYGALVTLDPTGVVLARPRAHLSLSDLFRSWGEPLTRSLLGPFAAPAGGAVSVFVDGRRSHGPPGAMPLKSRAEIVLEVGPYVPPHAYYAFPPGS